MGETPSLHQPYDLRRGALLVVVSALLFAGMAAAVRVASQELPTAPIVFFRHFLMLLFVAPWLIVQGRGALRTRDLRGHVVRGLAGLAAVSCYFYAIAHLPLADAVLLNQSLPLFVPLVERVWLGEPIPRRLWRVLLIGLCGLLLILRPGIGVFDPVALVGLASAIFASIAQVGIRRLTRTEPVTRIVVYFGLIAATAVAPAAALTWRTPSAAIWAVLLLLGVVATVGQLTLTRAYVYAPAARIGPFLYAGPVFAGLLDWALWGRLPDVLFVAGAVLVVTAATLALRIRGGAPVMTVAPVDPPGRSGYSPSIMAKIRPGTISVWEQLSPVLATLRLVPEEGHPFPRYEAGQYMALRREDCRLTRRVAGPDGETRFIPDLDETGRQKRGPVTHAYSIASAPFQTESLGYVEFLVVLELASTLGRFTESLFDMEPREGGEMGYVERIVGDFTLPRRTEGMPHVLMVATGTGLAPLASMVRQIDHDASSGRPVPQRVTLLFANRTAAELAFHEELAAIAAARRFDFVYVPSVSRPGDEQGREAIGRGRANNVLRLALDLPMAEEEALAEARKEGRDTKALEARAARAVAPHLPPGVDLRALRERLEPETTVVLTCGNAQAMADIRKAAETRGMRVEQEEW